MRLPPSSRAILAALPGTIVDVVQKTGLYEPSIRARLAELKRAEMVRVKGRKPRAIKQQGGGVWAIYEAA